MSACSGQGTPGTLPVFCAPWPQHFQVSPPPPLLDGALQPLTITGQVFRPHANGDELRCSADSKLSSCLLWPPTDHCLWDRMVGCVPMCPSFPPSMVSLSALPPESVRQFQRGATHHWTDSCCSWETFGKSGNPKSLRDRPQVTPLLLIRKLQRQNPGRMLISVIMKLLLDSPWSFCFF